MSHRPQRTAGRHIQPFPGHNVRDASRNGRFPDFSFWAQTEFRNCQNDAGWLPSRPDHGEEWCAKIGGAGDSRSDHTVNKKRRLERLHCQELVDSNLVRAGTLLPATIAAEGAVTMLVKLALLRLKLKSTEGTLASPEVKYPEPLRRSGLNETVIAGNKNHSILWICTANRAVVL